LMVAVLLLVFGASFGFVVLFWARSDIALVLQLLNYDAY
jgi:hypothetical protein